MDRVAHVRQLADELRIGLRLEPGLAGMMYVEFGYVEGPTPATLAGEVHRGHYPNEQSKHMTVLHEIGHGDMAHTQGRPPFVNSTFYFDHGVLRCEAEAWMWAMDVMDKLEPLEPATREFMWNTCLGSYYRGAKAVGFTTPGQRLGNGDRGYVPFAYGEPDQAFWYTVERMIGVSRANREKEGRMQIKES
jgi:hypothetical protein